ncbi:MAG: ferrous iron transporter B [Clostridia bacterium]|nr:ferrous iron transporter B [Clostridia bacterium]
MKILLVGNPNSGKTTLFNLLTGESAKVGNWHGVTVTPREGNIRKTPHTLVDLPGLYSIFSPRREEKAAAKAVLCNCDVIVNVIEARCLLRSLSLTRELIKLNKKIVLAITFKGELERSGGAINPVNLTKSTGIPCFIVDNELNVNVFLSVIESNFPSVKTIPDPPRSAYAPPENGGLSLVDKLLLSPISALPLFIIFMAAAFYITFGKYGAGAFLGAAFYSGIQKFTLFAEKSLTAAGVGNFFVRLVTEGIFYGLSGVASFVPQICVLYLCIIAMEESGFLSRAAFSLDGLFKKAGLSGKSVFPLLVGFGCTASAILASRSAESKTLQKRVILALHFVSCSARMPAFLLITSTFFKGNEFIAVSLVYAAGIVLALTASAFAARQSRHREEPFAMEIPPLRFPKVTVVFKQLKNFLKTFIIKTVTVLLAVSVAVWALRSFSPRFEFLSVSRMSESLLAKIGGALSFLFSPMGIRGWQIPAAALCGLVAKEGVVSALLLAYPLGISGKLSSSSALAFLVFTAYYTPCVVALSASAEETNRRLSAFYGVFSFLAALLLGYITYFAAAACSRFGAQNVIFTLFVVIAVVSGVKRITKRRKLKGDGHGPREEDCGKNWWEACEDCVGCRHSLFRGQKTPSQKGYKGERQASKL